MAVTRAEELEQSVALPLIAPFGRFRRTRKPSIWDDVLHARAFTEWGPHSPGRSLYRSVLLQNPGNDK
jgi:hypothetical protein